MAKISLIGAGSVVFARRLLQDIVCVPELSDATGSLMDTDLERLELMSKFANKLVRDTGTNIKAPPISYSVNGKQYIAIIAGGEISASWLNLPETEGLQFASTLYAFAL